MSETSQEALWAGAFGDEYIDRNRAGQAAAFHIFSRVFHRTGQLRSVLELGANIGLNLRAIRALSPDTVLDAVEINANAAKELESLGFIRTVQNRSILAMDQGNTVYDLVFTSGVLIHVNPDSLPAIYAKMYEASGRYILVNEYFNPTPLTVPYRGQSQALFKRDFAGELMDAYPDLELLDYEFLYSRAGLPGFCDSTWFLLKKTA